VWPVVGWLQGRQSCYAWNVFDIAMTHHRMTSEKVILQNSEIKTFPYNILQNTVWISFMKG
jgi:hypothetical protein